MRAICLAFLLCACGGDDGGNERAAEFIGTWMWSAGATITVDCDNDAGDSNEAETGTFEIQAGTSSDLVIVPDPSGSMASCPPVRYDVSGDTATAQAGQGCTYEEDVGVGTLMIMGTLNSGTGTLNADGTTLMVNNQLSANVTGLLTTTCTAEQIGSAAKVAN